MSASVVPARAGMSPHAGKTAACRGSGPRASGDEPLRADNSALRAEWSPRERG